MGLNVNLCGIELENPVIPASGTFGYGVEYGEIVDLGVLGGRVQHEGRKRRSIPGTSEPGDLFDRRRTDSEN